MKNKLSELMSRLNGINTCVHELPTVDVGPLGTVVAPSNLAELTQCLSLGTSREVLAWRGHADSAWLIDSTLVRRLEKMKLLLRNKTRTEGNAQAAERTLIDRTRVGGHGVVDGRELADLEILARLRHHGAATRLLDCTRNAYIAAWFAASQALEATGVIIGFAEPVPFLVDAPEKVRLRVEDLLEEMDERLGFWAPSWLSPRIAAQQSVFVFGRVTHAAWGSLPLSGDVRAGAGNVPSSVVIAITPHLKAQLVDQLKVVHGLTAERLFPDFDGFAAANGAGMLFPDDFQVSCSWSLPTMS